MRLIIFSLPSVFHTRPGHERARRSLAGGVLGWVLTPPGKCPGWPGRAPGPGRVCLLGHPARPGPGASPGAPCPVRAPASSTASGKVKAAEEKNNEEETEAAWRARVARETSVETNYLAASKLKVFTRFDKVSRGVLRRDGAYAFLPYGSKEAHGELQHMPSYDGIIKGGSIYYSLLDG